MGIGLLKVTVMTASRAIPIPEAVVTVSQNGIVSYRLITNQDGATDVVEIQAPDKAVTLDPTYEGEYYAKVDVSVIAQDCPAKTFIGVKILDTITTVLPVNLTPIVALDSKLANQRARTASGDVVNLGEHQLVTAGEDRPQEHSDLPPRTRILNEVVIPHQIRVHLGKPAENATNVTVDFKYYIKNVCTHEIFATWPDESLEANIYCQISLALNRIYTEWYPSQGYNFDITSSTYNDQNFVYQGEIDSNISSMVDEIFNRYARMVGHKEPYYTEYCDGIKATCPGLKQWGTVDLAQQGYSPLEMLQYYYGENIELVETDNIQYVEESYPGYPLSEGSNGPSVAGLQVYLNRIRVNYPTIPTITDPEGVFGPTTTAAVKAFKQAANWSQSSYAGSGVVDKATWYNISYAYYAIKKLGELSGEGDVIGIDRNPPTASISQGARGTDVGKLQYILNVLDDFYPEVPYTIQDYNFDQETVESVKAFQRAFGLTPDGVVGPATWNKLYEVYWSLYDNGLIDGGGGGEGGLPSYPGSSLSLGANGAAVKEMQKCLNNISLRYPSIGTLSEDGAFGSGTRNAVITFQTIFGLVPDGIVGPATWNAISQECANGSGSAGGLPAYPGYSISYGDSNDIVRQIQRCLNNVSRSYPSIPKLTEDGQFGNGTKNAVMIFQGLFGLSKDGIVGPGTWAKLAEECGASSGIPEYPGYSISLGSTGSYVSQIQECLNNVSRANSNIPSIMVDGQFGNGTRNAVIAFQREYGLEQDGIVGANTWNELMTECGNISRSLNTGTDSGMAVSNRISFSGEPENIISDNEKNYENPSVSATDTHTSAAPKYYGGVNARPPQYPYINPNRNVNIAKAAGPVYYVNDNPVSREHFGKPFDDERPIEKVDPSLMTFMLMLSLFSKDNATEA